ncbi:MAG: type I restriction-modification system subunit M [Blautia sp.]|nr:type I restriction-modification system subunit M [Blautia sp.]
MAEITMQQRDELHRAIWAIADDLRGSVDGWDFKNYVLGTMFYRYLSERFSAFIEKTEHDAGNLDFRYSSLSDEDALSIGEEEIADIIKTIGFFLKPSELFYNVCKRADKDPNLNETLEKIFRDIEASSKGTDSEDCFDGLFADFDVNSNRLGASVVKRNERLVKLLWGVRDMKLGAVNGHDIDAFGDAYEYLMTMYASGAGKSGGEFYTPQDVSELLTRLGTVGKTQVNKVYENCTTSLIRIQAA